MLVCTPELENGNDPKLAEKARKNAANRNLMNCDILGFLLSAGSIFESDKDFIPKKQIIKKDGAIYSFDFKTIDDGDLSSEENTTSMELNASLSSTAATYNYLVDLYSMDSNSILLNITYKNKLKLNYDLIPPSEGNTLIENISICLNYDYEGECDLFEYLVNLEKSVETADEYDTAETISDKEIIEWFQQEQETDFFMLTTELLRSSKELQSLSSKRLALTSIFNLVKSRQITPVFKRDNNSEYSDTIKRYLLELTILSKKNSITELEEIIFSWINTNSFILEIGIHTLRLKLLEYLRSTNLSGLVVDTGATIIGGDGLSSDKHIPNQVNLTEILDSNPNCLDLTLKLVLSVEALKMVMNNLLSISHETLGKILKKILNHYFGSECMKDFNDTTKDHPYKVSERFEKGATRLNMQMCISRWTNESKQVVKSSSRLEPMIWSVQWNEDNNMTKAILNTKFGSKFDENGIQWERVFGILRRLS